MPFRSVQQQRFLESKDSPLTPAQKKEWQDSTDYAALPKRVGPAPGAKGYKKPSHWTGK
jgi:hypothetical protein